MFVPLLSVVVVLALALVGLLVRLTRMRAHAREVPARLSALDARADAAVASAEWTTPGSAVDAEPARPEGPERRPGRRRVRRPVSPPAPLDRP